MKNIEFPELGEGIEQAVVAGWCFNEGDNVKEGDDVVELVTDKATFSVPSSFSGKLEKILTPVGSEVAVGATLAIVK